MTDQVLVAAIRAVVQHLREIGDSHALEDLRYDNPALNIEQAGRARELADLMARSIAAGIEATP